MIVQTLKSELHINSQTWVFPALATFRFTTHFDRNGQQAFVTFSGDFLYDVTPAARNRVPLAPHLCSRNVATPDDSRTLFLTFPCILFI